MNHFETAGETETTLQTPSTNCESFSSLDVWLWYLPAMNESRAFIIKSLHKQAIGFLLLVWEMNKTFSYRKKKILHCSLIHGDILLILSLDHCAGHPFYNITMLEYFFFLNQSQTFCFSLIVTLQMNACKFNDLIIKYLCKLKCSSSIMSYNIGC